jgi:hypothetical protein
MRSSSKKQKRISQKNSIFECRITTSNFMEYVRNANRNEDLLTKEAI